MSAKASALTMIPGATLMKNSQRQPSASVIQPPTVGPSVGASTETMPRMAGTIARWAQDLGIRSTGGSDFHGATTGLVELGAFTTKSVDFDALVALSETRQQAPELAAARTS